MYYTSKLFHSAKITCATLGLLLSGCTLIYGAIDNSQILYVVGTFFVCSSLFHCADASKVTLDIKKELHRIKNETKQLKKHNNDLGDTVTNLKKIEKGYIKQLGSVNKLMIDTSEQLEQIEILKCDFESENKALKTNLNKSKNLSDDLEKIKFQYEEENSKLQNNIHFLNVQMQDLEFIQITHKQELEKLSNENLKLDGTCKQLAKLYNNTKRLMVEIAQCNNEFASSIDSSTIKLDEKIDDVESVADKLNVLLTKLKNKTFGELDTNDDGVVSMKEFEEGLNK